MTKLPIEHKGYFKHRNLSIFLNEERVCLEFTLKNDATGITKEMVSVDKDTLKKCIELLEEIEG